MSKIKIFGLGGLNENGKNMYDPRGGKFAYDTHIFLKNWPKLMILLWLYNISCPFISDIFPFVVEIAPFVTNIRRFVGYDDSFLHIMIIFASLYLR